MGYVYEKHGVMLHDGCKDIEEAVRYVRGLSDLMGLICHGLVNVLYVAGSLIQNCLPCSCRGVYPFRYLQPPPLRI